jgi:adenylate kinase
MKGIIGITGCPATGKRTVGKILAAMLNMRFVDGNSLLRRHGALIGDEIIVEKGRGAFSKEAEKGNAIITGLFLFSLLEPKYPDLVVVLRCDPRILYYRYLKRGYPLKKVKENLTAEFLDYCLVESIKAFGAEKVVQVDTTRRTPKSAARLIAKIWKGETERKGDHVDWLSLIGSARDLTDFLV